MYLYHGLAANRPVKKKKTFAIGQAYSLVHLASYITPQLIEHKKIVFLTKIMNFEELQKNT